ncbi:hypothetical protein PMA3_09985 [Pseudomonas silesiensis]|uniref:Uncharacterized protein n=1 Tax=Pseudomonas silesiensis TaxID=1853130 RepID=A0A191YRR5_9PSED|nr:hypothetical protein PMA3_09985 [Pseudomonas silesiensis]
MVETGIIGATRIVATNGVMMIMGMIDTIVVIIISGMIGIGIGIGIVIVETTKPLTLTEGLQSWKR